MQQDKTDFYRNGVLAGAVNNLYYDLINVDICHVPYATNHRNSSFFLKTRAGYQPEKNWDDVLVQYIKDNRDIVDVHIIRDEKCNQSSGKLYLLAREKNRGSKRRIFTAPIVNGCVGAFDNPNYHSFETTVSGCGDRKFFVTDYVRGESIDAEESLIYTSEKSTGGATGVQINKITGGTTIGLFEDVDTKAGYAKRNQSKVTRGMYLLVYASKNKEGSGHAGQVRMVTGISSDGRTIELDSPWLGFKAPSEGNPVWGGDLNYSFFSERGEVVGFTDGRDIQLITDYENNRVTRPYTHSGTTEATNTNIIGVASAASKIFILTDSGYIHYNKDSGGYNKFFINDDMFAGPDKISIAAYRDIVLAFGRRHISIGVPDESNSYRTMYNQSTTIGLRSRYSYAEYEGDLIFVSNDKRLLALTINSSGRYGLSFEDVGDRINGKLSTLVEGDEAFIGSDKNDLRVFVNTKSTPYKVVDGSIVLKDGNNTSTHIYKFDTLFKVRTEDHIPHFLLRGCKFGIYYGQYGVYVKGWHIGDNEYEDMSADVFSTDTRRHPVETIISAYLIENENNGLDNHPILFNLAKLNRLITTLGPGVYSSASKMLITEYTRGVGFTYEFPINGDGNKRLSFMTDLYLGHNIDSETEKGEDNPFLCAIEDKKDSQNLYKVNCSESQLKSQYLVPESPRCSSNRDFLYQDHDLCVNDELYRVAPTMPLVTDLGEIQDYSTQIKLELIGGGGDIICFGGRLAELFIAPLFTKGPDGEYQLQPNSDC